MKNIIIILIFWISCFKVFAQLPSLPINTFCEDGGFESGVINTNDFRYGFGHYDSSINAIGTIPAFNTPTFESMLGTLAIYSPNTPPNTPSNPKVNFNQFYEYITSVSSPREMYNSLLDYQYKIPPPVYLTPWSDYPEDQIHHKIESPGPDDMIGNLLNKVHSGSFSFRLGNASPVKGFELMQKTFTVTPSNSQFSFWYAAVIGDPDEGHRTKPTFVVKIKNNSNNSFVNGLVNLGNGQNFIDDNTGIINQTPIWTINNVSQTQSEPIKYMPWSYVSIDLSSLIGNTITLFFVTVDCNQGGHFAYVYLDDFCTEPTTDNPSGSINLQNVSSCGPGEICVDYTLPTLPDGSAGEVNLSLNIYQNGNLVNTLNSGILNSGNSYCFTISPALLNTLSGTYFDYVVRGDFSINATSLPSQNIGVPGFGQNGTQNDDYAVSCESNPTDPSLCCDIPGFEVSIRKPRFGSDQLSLILSGITTPVQEIEVSVIDYHVTYGDPACRPASLGIFGNLSSNQSTLNGLNLNGSGTQVLDWTAGTPGVFNGQIPIKISKPSILKLSCCKGTFSFCLKIKIVDVNCNVCEKIVCFDLPLEEQKIISHEPPKEIGDLGDPKPTGPIIIGDLSDLPITNPNDVYNPKTGKTWMNKNLGASQVATSPTDSLAYGDLYQWGRLTDGHEKRTSNTTTTLSNSDVPGHGDFILHPNLPAPLSWNSPVNINLWQGVNGTNNPCPTGYRIPTDGELAAERLSWATPDAAGAFASPLKWTLAGNRIYINGQIVNAGLRGSYWSSLTNGAMSSYMYFNNGSSSPSNNYQTADGASVRCIKN